MARALLVIDIQEDYFPGGVLPLDQAEEVEKRAVSAIQQADKAGDRVILVQHISDAPGLFARDGAGIMIRPAIRAAATEAPVVVKKFADSFQETDLRTHLDGVTELLICGMMTQNCVAFTAMSELASGLDISVIGDLCAAPSEIVHLVALNAIGSKRRIVSSSDLWS